MSEAAHEAVLSPARHPEIVNKLMGSGATHGVWAGVWPSGAGLSDNSVEYMGTEAE